MNPLRYLAPRTQQLAETYNLALDDGPYSHATRLCDVESVVHELTHHVVAGIRLVNNGVSSSDRLRFHLEAMAPQRSDPQELRTMAVEHLVLKHYGIHTSLRKLAWFAYKGLRTKRPRTEILRRITRYLTAPYTQRHVKCVIDILEHQ